MHLRLFTLLCSFVITEGIHFDGGTISWAPINPFDNSSSIGVSITQSYAYAYPIITCAPNVPITTSGRSTQNWNLTCVVDCSTDGGYSTQPIDILTDCTSVSTSLGMMNSQRSHNLTLTAGAHFYLANVGSAWVALNDPPQSGLQWSIITLIDLRMRPDGFINTPPVASVVSPQYAFVNQTIEISIPVSDVNAGDDVRCRWSTYTAGYRRRKRSNEEIHTNHQSSPYTYNGLNEFNENIHIRKKRSCACPAGKNCGSVSCQTAQNCPGGSCSVTCCDNVLDTTTTTTTTTDSTTAISTTTIDNPGMLKSTSSYPHRQAIDECGGICYPGSLPNGTTLSDCTITLTGLKAGTWYGVAVQVDDFINDTSTISMSSVPVQFVIYVLPTPACSMAPIILSVNGCLEVQAGVSISFSIYAMNLCDPSVANLTDIIVSSGITGMSVSNLISSPTDPSLSYVTFTWTPQANQVGSQQLCVIAFTSEKVQSDQSCTTFTVKTTSDICVTTTTTSTSTTSQTTTTTSQTTITTLSTTTSQTTTTTSVTTTTTSTVTTSTSTKTSTTTTSVTTITSTSTTATTATAITVTSATTSTKASEKPSNWFLILALLLLALLLVLCCACCCLFCFLWGPAARRRRRRKEEEDAGEETFFPRNIANPTRKRRVIIPLYQPRTSSKDHLTDNISYTKDSMTSNSSSDLRRSLSRSTAVVTNIEGENIVSSTISVQRIKRTNIVNINNTEKPDETTDSHRQPTNHRDSSGNSFAIRRSSVPVRRINKLPNTDETHKRHSSVTRQNTRSTMLTVPLNRGTGVVVTNISRKLTACQSHRS